MSLVTVIGDAASTTAVGLAAAWPRGERVILVELDPAGGSLAAWLEVPRSPGLSGLVAADHPGSWPTIEAHVQRSRSGLELLAAPVRAIEAAAAVAAASASVVPLLSALHEPVAVVDAGRTSHGVPVAAGSAALVVVVHRQHRHAASAAAVRFERLAHTCERLALRSIPCVVALIGDHPYGADEVARFVGADSVVALPVDPWAAAVLAGRVGSARRLRRSPLLRSLSPLAEIASATLRQARSDMTWVGHRFDRSGLAP